MPKLKQLLLWCSRWLASLAGGQGEDGAQASAGQLSERIKDLQVVVALARRDYEGATKRFEALDAQLKEWEESGTKNKGQLRFLKSDIDLALRQVNQSYSAASLAQSQLLQATTARDIREETTTPLPISGEEWVAMGKQLEVFRQVKSRVDAEFRMVDGMACPDLNEVRDLAKPVAARRENSAAAAPELFLANLEGPAKAAEKE